MSEISFGVINGDSEREMRLDSTPGASWLRLREGDEGGTVALPDQVAEVLSMTRSQASALFQPAVREVWEREFKL